MQELLRVGGRFTQTEILSVAAMHWTVSGIPAGSRTVMSASL